MSAAATIGEIADYLINGFWPDMGLGARHFAGKTITFNLTGLEPERASLARKAFEEWAKVSSLTFKEVSALDAQIMLDDARAGASAASTVNPDGTIVQSRVNVSKDWFGGIDDVNSYTFHTFLHEIGHALGLGHAGNYDGSATYKAGDATWQDTLMSYHSQRDGASYAYAVTPMPADIEAMQRIYGASDVTLGDTVHRPTLAAAMTVYDAGGHDTLDLSAFSQDQRIDLRPGHFSDVGGLVGNMALLGTMERVIGGSGNDTVVLGFRLVDAGLSQVTLSAFERFVFADGAVDNNDGNWLVDDLFYFSTYHDVWSARVDADTHYANYGRHEGRDPNVLFDTAGYLSVYTDVAAAGVNPFDHYNTHGWREGRDPSVDFDGSSYLGAYPDVAAAGINPLEHYLHYGIHEGRSPFADSLWG